jgi:hypothetical protein
VNVKDLFHAVQGLLCENVNAKDLFHVLDRFLSFINLLLNSTLLTGVRHCCC